MLITVSGVYGPSSCLSWQQLHRRGITCISCSQAATPLLCCCCCALGLVQVPSRSTDSYHEENNGPPTEGLVYMGLLSLVDPPREGVLEAVNK